MLVVATVLNLTSLVFTRGILYVVRRYLRTSIIRSEVHTREGNVVSGEMTGAESVSSPAQVTTGLIFSVVQLMISLSCAVGESPVVAHISKTVPSSLR